MSNYQLGIDIGSTTAKAAICKPRSNEILFSSYRRHNAETVKTLQVMLAEVRDQLGDV